jgi:hypothetical protein
MFYTGITAFELSLKPDTFEIKCRKFSDNIKFIYTSDSKIKIYDIQFQPKRLIK